MTRRKIHDHKGGTECCMPRKKPSTGYQYGCRCNRCLDWYVTYWKFNKSKYTRESTKPICPQCGQRHIKTQFPICKQCWTPFIKRCSGLPWSWVKRQIERSACFICETPIDMNQPGKGGRHWQVDHDHRISRWVRKESVREVLCGPCNSKVGHIEAARDAGLLHKIIEYTEQTHARV